MSEAPNPGPLAGLRVVELGQLIAGPFAARMLADFGAEVIKVESPGTGDPLREWGQERVNGRGLWWPVQSRNKRLVTLDLHHAEGPGLLLRLLERSDVLIENFRPGTLERWGLEPARLARANPGLIVARISGYGQTGPYASRAGFASVGEAMSGLRYINGHPGEAPPRAGISLGDSLASMFAVQGILMALHHRDTNGGRGQVVDASIIESCFALLEAMVPEYGVAGRVREPSGSALAGIAPSNVYRSRDGRWMVIAANSPNLWDRLCRVLGRSELLDDPRYRTHRDRGAHMAELDAIVGEWAGRHDAAEIDRVLNDAGVVCGPVYTIADVFGDPQVEARRMIVELEDPEIGAVPMPGVVPVLSETPGGARWTGPWELGVDNQRIWGDLVGLAPDELERLGAEGVL